MCLGIPGRVVQISGEGVLRTGKVDFDGIIKDVNLAYVPEVEIGDYTIVQVGFAITQLDEESARETLDLIRQLDVLETELDPKAALAAEESAATDQE